MMRAFCSYSFYKLRRSIPGAVLETPPLWFLPPVRIKHTKGQYATARRAGYIRWNNCTIGLFV